MDDSEVHIASSSIHVDCNDPPQVSFTPLKGQDLPCRSKPWTESELPVDILLLTVKDCEFLSCISYLNPGYHKSYHTNLGYVYFGKMGKEECLKVAVMEFFVGSGPSASCITVKNAVALLKPKCVFCVGFCSGLNISKEVKLGDVVISGKYLTETKSKNQKRSVSIPSSSRIASIIKRAADGWSPPVIDPKEREVKVHVGGLFLSGTEEELNNVEQREELVKRFPQATAIVTESEGESCETLYDQSISQNISAPHLCHLMIFIKAPVHLSWCVKTNSFPSVPLSVILQAICLPLVKGHVPLNYGGA